MDEVALAVALGADGPAGALHPFGAAYDLPVPAHGEVGEGEGVAATAALPAQVASSGTDEVDAVALAGRDEEGCADIGGVHQVLGRGQASGGERVVDRRRAW